MYRCITQQQLLWLPGNGCHGNDVQGDDRRWNQEEAAGRLSAVKRLRYHSVRRGETKGVPESHTTAGRSDTDANLTGNSCKQGRNPNAHSYNPQFEDEELNAPWTQLRAEDIGPNGDTRGTVFKAKKHHATPTAAFHFLEKPGERLCWMLAQSAQDMERYKCTQFAFLDDAKRNRNTAAYLRLLSSHICSVTTTLRAEPTLSAFTKKLHNLAAIREQK
ncbi:hypothetical protein NQZ68_022420 [Dissostichus eleginoides]|nr:hypothetical protein NQZ68_022420 [Dissostichus eleginoides]